MPKEGQSKTFDPNIKVRKTRLQQIATNRIPLVGGLLRAVALNQLLAQVRKGSRAQAYAAAAILENHPEQSIERSITECLGQPLPQPSIDGIWDVWELTLSSVLIKVLFSQKRPASSPLERRVISHLKLGILPPLAQSGPDIIPILIACAAHSDTTIADNANKVLHNLKKAEAVSALCSLWKQSRNPALTQILQEAAYKPGRPPDVFVYVSLKFSYMDLVTCTGDEKCVNPLLQACTDTDSDISKNARLCIRNLKSEPAINELCKLWLETRDPILADAVAQSRYLASQPVNVRIFSALKTGHDEVVRSILPGELSILIQAAQDNDPQISSSAMRSLHTLEIQETREALCSLAMDQNFILAAQICVEAGYRPQSPEKLALFLFLTDQWEAYQTLDFDQRLLRTLFAAANESVRQRIAQKIQTSGRIEYLRALTGADYRTTAARMTPEEIEVIIRMLSSNAEWDKLWSLVFDFPLRWSIQALNLILNSNWSPKDERLKEFSLTLKALLDQPLPNLETQDWIMQLPLAVPRAVLNVRGRVNDVAFSPTESHIAIGTNQAKTIIWDYQSARILRSLNGFEHALSEVAYGNNGMLVCGERAGRQQNGWLSIFEGENLVHLGHHVGNVTAVEPVGQFMLLSGGRDQRLILWDLTTRQKVAEQLLPFWPRSVSISSDNQRVLLLQEYVSLANLPDLQSVQVLKNAPSRSGVIRKSMMCNAVFIDGNAGYLVGHFNGQLISYQPIQNSQHLRRKLISSFRKPVVGIQEIPGHEMIVAAGGEGDLLFIRKPDLLVSGKAASSGKAYTSLHVSSDGSFMATGTSDSAMILWDLRVMDIPELIARPLGQALSSHLGACNSLAEDDRLPAEIRNSMRIMASLLQFRFQFDIQLGELPSIQPGEFDIIVE